MTKEQYEVVEVFEGTFNTCYIVISEEKILVNLTFTNAFNNYQFVDGSKFGVEEEISRKRALKIAAAYGLESEVRTCMDLVGMTPTEALAEWDLL